MTKYTARLAFSVFAVFAAALVGASACSDKSAEASQRDIALPPSSTGKPALHDVPAAPPPPRATIPAGARVAVTVSSKACTNTQKVGDQITGTVVDPVQGTSGGAIPAGATVAFEVTESQYGQNDEKAVRLQLRPVSVAFSGNSYPLQGATIDAFKLKTVRRQSTGTQVGKVATGAAIGAIVGKVAGRSTGATVAGGVAGAAGGAMVAAGTADYDGCVPADQRLTISLTETLRVR